VSEIEDPSNDPGWRLALNGVGWLLIPGVGLQRQQRAVQEGRADGLVALRGVFLAFAAVFVIIGGVVGLLDATHGLQSNGWSSTVVAVAVVVIGAAALILLRSPNPRLVCTDDRSLATSYRSRFFYRMGVSDAIGLLGFAAFIITANPLMYPLGLIFTVIGFIWNAPTAAHIAADQDVLRGEGCAPPLMTVLRTTPPQSPNR
jgi:hypothetical protein